jgi:hypothetical protein
MRFPTKKDIFTAPGSAFWGGLGVLILGAVAGWLTYLGPEQTLAESSSQMLPATQPASSAIAKYHSTIEPILQDRCFDCHSGKNNHTPIAFDALTTNDSIVKNPELWLKVLKNTRSHVMPPPDEDQPTPQEQATLENWIEYSAFGVDPDHLDPGRQTLRRLNRTEYHNTIMDLTGVDFDVDSQFPADDIGYGFDNIGDVLNVSPMLMEKYVQAAQNIVAQAVPPTARIMPVQTIPGSRFSDSRSGGFRTGGGSRPGGFRGGSLDLSYFTEAKVTHTFNVPADGDYRIVLDWNVRGGFDFVPAQCTVTYSDDSDELGKHEFAYHDNDSGTERLSMHWSAGAHRFSIALHPASSATPPPLPATMPTTQPAAAKDSKNPPSANNTPSVSFRLLRVRLEGPMDPAHWPLAPGYRRFFSRGEPPTDSAGRRDYAREILGAFAIRAFRRPVPEQTLDRLVEISQSVSEAPGGTFERGVSQAMVAILASPRFLYRIESGEPGPADGPFVNVDEYSLASRLSYFLWSTMPDDELFKLAASGQLRKNLRAQVNRMLADPRSENLVENFTGQWLQSRAVGSVSINPHAVMQREGAFVPFNTQIEGPVRQALQQEPEAYFSYIMHGDRSVKEFIDSDYVFLNQTLADYYKMPAVNGPEMRKVMLESGDLRGGVLTMGATLMVTSNPTRTSPVKRGKWVLENILDAPAPPPPPDIPPLEQAAHQIKGQTPTLRQILATHRANPQCASCHDRMDPLGLAMENFNAEGLFRKQELNQPIDASGQLYTGEKFQNVGDLKQILLKNHLTEFYRCLTEKLLTYATGRGLEYYDMPTVDQIVGRLDQEDGRFSVLLLGVIESAPFQEERVSNQPALVEGAK